MEKTNRTTNKALLIYFILTFIFSWMFWLIGILASYDQITIPLPNLVFVVIGAHGPLVAAFGLTYKNEGRKAVKNLLFSGFNMRMKPVWWVVILLLPFLLSGLTVWINVVQSDFQQDRTLISQPVLIFSTFLMMFFLGGSFQEEFGWRGYALPKLLQKWNPLIASLLLGAIWGLWHLPLFYISGTSQVFMSFGVFFLLTIAFSVMFTWFYLKTYSNLFGALLFHTAINTALSVFPPVEQIIGGNQMAFTYLMIAYVFVALIIVVFDRPLWFRTLALKRQARYNTVLAPTTARESS